MYWDTLLQTLEGHAAEVTSIAFSPDGTQVVSGSWDRTVRSWDAATGDLLQTLKGHSDRVMSVAFSPDGTQVVSGSGDITVRLWDAATGDLLQTLNGHSDNVTSVAFSPDGTQVVSGSKDRIIRLWDAATGDLLQTFWPDSSKAAPLSFLLNDKSNSKILISRDWIVEGDINILWIPPDCRDLDGLVSATWNRCLAIGHPSGRILLLSFRDGAKLVI